ncbi:hypothetical protein YA0089_28135 [Pseudomonas viridiflava]|uniref:DUF6012 family protein n=1 Tax=Pseudomonas viridiflava TaxID=33069 RepID=UPI0018E5C08D|nr:DUF6012 family protein [Pseudomonas viridiflava]MBI6727492.1 hypothetical protein [Pseudomonas viridiflava]
MLIHIAPRLYATEPSELVDIKIPEINLHLTAPDDLMLCRPYRNKVYLVACLKGKYGHEGLIIRSPKLLHKFSVHTRWNIIGQGFAEHIVNYTVDENFDIENGMISDNRPRMEVRKTLNEEIFIKTNGVDEIVGQYLKKRCEDRFVSNTPRSAYFCNRHWNHQPPLEQVFDVINT